MVEMVLFVISLLGFATCCRLFLKAMVVPSPVFNTSGFSKSALRLERYYLIVAWGSMMFLFLASFFYSMIEIYFSL